MSTPENEPPKATLPENSNVKHNALDVYDNALCQTPNNKLSTRGLWAMVTGALSGAAAWFSAHIYAQDKMLEYEAEYQKRSVDMIMGRGGLGAAAAETGAGIVGHHPYVNTLGNLGPGMSAGAIEQSVATNMLLENPGKYNFAKWMRRIGGKGTFGMGVGLATGAAVGLATYAVLKDKSKEHGPAVDTENKGDWQSRVDTDKDKPRTLE